MRMKKTKGKYLIIFGAVLLIAALSLIIYNILQDKSGGDYARSVLLELKSEIPELDDSPEKSTYETITDDLFAVYEEDDVEEKIEEVKVEIDGNSYVGIISIPNLNIELPVMSEWSYPKLKKSPCRYTGNAETGNMIIAAHNYSSHFGRISELTDGDEIIFTAMDGKVYKYCVAQTETLGGTDVERLMRDEKDDWSLTLFTCTLSGQSRVCVRAEKAE